LEPVHGLDSQPSELLAAVAQHPQRFELTVGAQHAEGVGADRDDGDGVGVAGIGLAVVAGIEEPDPGGQFGWDVHDVLAGLEESLGQWGADAVASLDRPDPVGPGLRVRSHRGVAGLVGAEPTGAQEFLVTVDDLDRGRQFVGIDPDDHLRHNTSPASPRTDQDGEVGSAATSCAVPFRATPRHGARRTADRKRATPLDRWAAA